MEQAQRDLVSVLLGQLLAQGLISQFTYSGAEDLVHSVMDIPELFRYPVGLNKEGCEHECTQNPK